MEHQWGKGGEGRGGLDGRGCNAAPWSPQLVGTLSPPSLTLHPLPAPPPQQLSPWHRLLSSVPKCVLPSAPGPLKETLLGHRPPPCGVSSSPPSRVRARSPWLGASRVLGSRQGHGAMWRSGAGAVMNLTTQPPPFPCQPAPGPDSAPGLPWAAVSSNGRSGRACGSQERAGPLLWVLSPFTLSFILYSDLHFHFLLLICFLPSVLCNLSLYGSLYFFPRLGLSPQPCLAATQNIRSVSSR